MTLRYGLARLSDGLMRIGLYPSSPDLTKKNLIQGKTNLLI